MKSNPYQTSQVSAFPVSDASVDARAAFLQKTYLHLLGAILAFIAIDATLLSLFGEQLGALVGTVTGGFSWLFVLAAFMVVSYVADRWAHSRVSRSMQYLGLGLYVVAEAIIFIPLLYFAQRHQSDIIPSAGLVTALIFGGLTAVVMVTRTDFSFLKWGLVTLSIGALALIVASIVLGFSLGIVFSVAMVVLASGVILYNTSKVMRDYNTDQHVAASLTLFASVALMFWYVIQIFMHMDE